MGKLIRIWIHESKLPLSHKFIRIQVKIFITINKSMSTLTPNTSEKLKAVLM